MGRPSEFSPEIADKICNLLSENGSIRATCAEIGISRTTLDNWCDKNEDFSAAIARAKRAGYDNRAEEAVEAAKSGGEPLRARLAFDAERWYLSKIDPKRYGERIAQEISGPGGGPVQTESTIRNTEEQQAFARLMAQANKELG